MNKNNYKWDSVPETERVFTAKQLAEIFKTAPTYIITLAHNIGVDTKKRMNIPEATQKVTYFDFQDYLVFKKYYAGRPHKNTNVFHEDYTNIELMRKNHPLVTDDRFFNLYYFPDVIPDCFEEVDNWKV